MVTSTYVSAAEFIPAKQYLDELLVLIPAARQRIIIHAMLIKWGGHTLKIASLLKTALSRGVPVTLLGDKYTDFDGAISLNKGETDNQSKELVKAGASVMYVGKLGANPFKGRCHSKITVVDNDCFSFGGVNFASGAFDARDFMLAFRNDAALADYLVGLTKQIASDALPTSDIIKQISATDTLLFDVGTPGQSVIYQKAVELTQTASEIWFVSQMLPSGELGKALMGKSARCYFNRMYWKTLSNLPNNLGLAVDSLQPHVVNLYERSEFVHAKFMLFAMPDGSKQLITGSNNFSYRGVAYGSKEIALLSSDPQLWERLASYLRDEIA